MSDSIETNAAAGIRAFYFKKLDGSESGAHLLSKGGNFSLSQQLYRPDVMHAGRRSKNSGTS